MHKIQPRPVAVDGQVVIRPMMYLALTYDHRIVDGREAVQFLVRIKDLVEDPTALLSTAGSSCWQSKRACEIITVPNCSTQSRVAPVDHPWLCRAARREVRRPVRNSDRA